MVVAAVIQTTRIAITAIITVIAKIVTIAITNFNNSESNGNRNDTERKMTAPPSAEI